MSIHTSQAQTFCEGGNEFFLFVYEQHGPCLHNGLPKRFSAADASLWGPLVYAGELQTEFLSSKKGAMFADKIPVAVNSLALLRENGKLL